MLLIECAVSSTPNWRIRRFLKMLPPRLQDLRHQYYHSILLFLLLRLPLLRRSLPLLIADYGRRPSLHVPEAQLVEKQSKCDG